MIKINIFIVCTIIFTTPIVNTDGPNPLFFLHDTINYLTYTPHLKNWSTLLYADRTKIKSVAALAILGIIGWQYKKLLWAKPLQRSIKRLKPTAPTTKELIITLKPPTTSPMAPSTTPPINQQPSINATQRKPLTITIPNTSNNTIAIIEGTTNINDLGIIDTITKLDHYTQEHRLFESNNHLLRLLNEAIIVNNLLLPRKMRELSPETALESIIAWYATKEQITTLITRTIIPFLLTCAIKINYGARKVHAQHIATVLQNYIQKHTEMNLSPEIIDTINTIVNQNSASPTHVSPEKTIYLYRPDNNSVGDIITKPYSAIKPNHIKPNPLYEKPQTAQ